MVDFKNLLPLALCLSAVYSAPSGLSHLVPKDVNIIESKDSFTQSQTIMDPFPNYFPNQQDAGTISLFPMPLCNGISLEEASIDDIRLALTIRKLNTTTLLGCFMNRINQIDGYVNSVLQLNPDAQSIAAQLDAEREAGQVRGPLHGIPFLIKDNIGSKDQMDTTAGSWALVGSVVPRDAHVVSKLRDAGALLLGKATLSEWADMRTSNYSEGYSGRGGQARSAYNFTVNPGGSSSGSAIAVSCNIVPFALGTETDGSVINPAERNSIVGIKPTVGLTSRAGVIPESTHQDTVGVFGKTVKDAVYALDAIYGMDTRDEFTYNQTGKTPSDGYLQYLNTSDALKGATFGIPWDTFWTLAGQDQVDQLMHVIKLIESAGATVKNNTELPDASKTVSPYGWDWSLNCERGRLDECEFLVIAVDFYNNIESYLSELNNTNIRTLQDIVDYNIANVGTEGGTPGIHPAFGAGQDQLLASLATGGKMNSTYWAALNWTQSTTRHQIDTALQLGRSDQLDGLLVPPDVAQAPQVAAQAGYPMITLPVGAHAESHMPFGLAIMNTAWSEGTLIKWASAIEDLQVKSNTTFKRQLPKWYGYLDRNIPLLNVS